MSFYEEICSHILTRKSISKEEIHRLKIKLCKKYHLSNIPSNSDIIAHIPKHYSPSEKKQLTQSLQRKPMRTISGVSIVAVMTSPAQCPHGLCTPCPGGPQVDSPQSYTGFEPAAMRAHIHQYDPLQQVQARIHQLQCIGHPTDKIDLIIMGGTFTARNPWYQQWYIKRCYDAMNTTPSSTLSEAMKQNEHAKHRCIGLTIETRPDWLRLQQTDRILSYGATRVELGIQTIYDEILTTIKRGHTVSDSIDATRIAKDSGLKVCYHLMPGLPGSNKQKDKESFTTVFTDQNFKPDMIKIYPCLVIRGTSLYDQWKNGEYTPLTSSEAATQIASVLPHLPEWIRIQRIQRDVPAQYIEAGVTKSNLRQIVEETLKNSDESTKDLRSREIGHMSLQQKQNIDVSETFLKSTTYDASDGTEIFISVITEPSQAVVGYLRLRHIHTSHRPELQNKNITIIRELKVVGRELELGIKSNTDIQHKGFGTHLINEAIRLSTEKFDAKELYVLSGTGVKPYYRKYHHFKDKGIYLYKTLT